METKLKKRGLFLLIVIILGFSGVIFRMGYIQVVKGEMLRAEVSNAKEYKARTFYERGTIYDRNNNILAVSEKVNKVSINNLDALMKMKESTEKVNREFYVDFLEELSEVLNYLPSEIEEKLNNATGSAVLLRTEVRDDEFKLIDKKYHNYLQVEQKYVRRYPFGHVASNVIGIKQDYTDEKVFPNNDAPVIRVKGVSGVEGYYEDVLKGENGRVYTQTDGNNRELVENNRAVIPVKHGNDVHLTIDIYLQREVEKLMEVVYQDYNPEEIGVIVMDVQTGELLTMAQVPNVDLNNVNQVFGPSEEELKRLYIEAKDEYTPEEQVIVDERKALIQLARENQLIQSRYEMGSSFKLLTAAIALEAGTSDLQRTYNEGSRFYIGDTYVSCWQTPHRHEENLTLAEAVRDSCNPVFVRLLADMGIETYQEYMDRFGFTKKTGIDLGGEKNQDYPESKYFVDNARYTFGQGLLVTPIRATTSLAAVFNGGELLKPYVVDKITKDIDGESTIVNETQKQIEKLPITDLTSYKMRDIMTYVVDEAYNDKVGVEGYEIGGKTGTAQVFDNEIGMYSNDKFIASFVAGIPMNDPKYIVFAYVKYPEGDIYGSVVAAPLAGDVIKKMIDQLEVPSSVEVPQVVIPDVVGMTAEEAKEVLTEAGLNYNWKDKETVTDESIITAQQPKPGSRHNKGQSVMLYHK